MNIRFGGLTANNGKPDEDKGTEELKENRRGPLFTAASDATELKM